MKVLNSFNFKNDFWKENPLLEIPMKDFQSQVKDPKEQSRIMWAIALIHSPESKYANLPPSQREALIKMDYLNDEEFDFSPYKKTIEKFVELCTTPAQRLMGSWYRKYEERQQFIDETPYNENTFDMLEKLIGNTDKFWKQYQAIKKEVEAEEAAQEIVHGGATLSLSDKKLI